MTYFLPSVQKTCLLHSVHFKLNKLETVLNCKQVQTLNIFKHWNRLDILSRHGSVGSWSCWPCCTCLCFPRPGPHNWICAARSNDTLWWLYDTCIILYQIRWHSMIFVYICFSSAGSEATPSEITIQILVVHASKSGQTVWRCSASPFSVPLPNWMLLIRDTNSRSKWWCKQRLIRLTFTTLVSAVLHRPMFRLLSTKASGQLRSPGTLHARHQYGGTSMPFLQTATCLHTTSMPSSTTFLSTMSSPKSL